MEGGPGGGQNAQGRKSRGTAYLSSDIRLGLSFEGCHQQWEGSRPVRSGQASPLSLLLDTQGLIDSQGLAAPQERSCSVSTDPCVHKELPPGACGGVGGWAHTRCESHLWPTGLVLNAQTQGPAWLTCWDRSSQSSPASTRQEVPACLCVLHKAAQPPERTSPLLSQQWHFPGTFPLGACLAGTRPPSSTSMDDALSHGH